MEEVRSSILLSSTERDVCEGPVSDWSLAGFVAGEGSFGVTTKQPPYRDGDPRLRFVLDVKVASRDRALLEAIQLRLGVGSIRDERPRRTGWQPLSAYRVGSVRAHRRAVIPFMERFLLPSAKREQFERWRDALDSYERLHPNRWGKGPSSCRIEGCGRPVRGRGLCRSHYYEATGY